MSFLTALDAEVQKATRPAQCLVAIAIATSPEGDQIKAAIDDDRIAGSQIARALVAAGFKASGGSVQRHRRGECRCNRGA